MGFLDRLKGGLPDELFTKPPTYAALAFTLSQTFELLTRPDTIYVPLVMEIPLFLISFILIFMCNLLLVPFMLRIMRIRSEQWIGAAMIIGLPVALTLAFWLGGIFKPRQILKLTYFLSVVVPSSVLAAAAYWRLKQYLENKTSDDAI